MPLPSPFHARTAPLCESYRWKDWAGYCAVCAYDTPADGEYFALRQASGLIDVTPLFKVAVTGADAAELLSWVWTRDVRKLAPGRVAYGPWCDERGQVLDDGTVTCWEPGRYRVTSAEPCYAWLAREARGWDVELAEETARVAALALQGPTARAVLRELLGDEAAQLGYFHAARFALDGPAGTNAIGVEVTRTGYTGDLGYELWVAAEHALALWDALLGAGRDHGLQPVGLDALDVARVEAGFILGGVDYTSARNALIPSQRSTPYELGLGWAVHPERGPFIGREALRREKARGPRRALVGLELDWQALEQLYASYGLPPHLSTAAWRTPVPVYAGGAQVGRATSGAWSPTLKKNLALATVGAAQAALGTRLAIEVTVEHERRTVPATVVRRPFFDPPRKRA